MNNHFRPQNEFEVFNPKIFKLENGFEGLFKYVENELESKKLGNIQIEYLGHIFQNFIELNGEKILLN